MLRIFLWYGMLALLAGGCNNTHHDSGKKGISAKGLTSRNTAITRQNAYNDLFLDSVQLERFIALQKLDDNLSNSMRSFYQARNFQYAWLYSKGLTEQALGFRSLYDYYKGSSTPQPALENRLDKLVNQENPVLQATDPAIRETELQLTLRLMHDGLHTFREAGICTRQLEHLVPLQKQGILQLADSVLADENGDNHQLGQVNRVYQLLYVQLKRYRALEKSGGWPAISLEQKSLRKGSRNPVVARLKQRLRLTGEWQGNDTLPVFDEALENAVRTFQQCHGWKPDGLVTAALVREMNVQPLQRIQQLLLNMERSRWMPGQPQGRQVRVNIPGFMLYVRDSNSKVWDMPVVVGKEGHYTTMFSGKLTQVVFSPYWNLPRGIIRTEVLPAMERNPHYLEEHRMEVTGQRYGLPVIRQQPGDKNALGRVKFFFPNSFNIYLHDTPAKELFTRSKRAYSHGCIRLADPVKLANYLLQDQPGRPVQSTVP